MEKAVQEKLENAGVDISAALERFLGNEDLLIQFLRKFSEDKNYYAFQEAMQKRQFGDAFKAIHNLKGLCGNLSIIPLFETVSIEVEFLRNGENEAAMDFVPEVEEKYDIAVTILDSL